MAPSLASSDSSAPHTQCRSSFATCKKRPDCADCASVPPAILPSSRWRLELTTGSTCHQASSGNAAEARRRSLLPRAALPSTLQELHAELTRKRQVILQGPPGVGKTWIARQYIDWVTAGKIARHSSPRVPAGRPNPTKRRRGSPMPSKLSARRRSGTSFSSIPPIPTRTLCVACKPSWSWAVVTFRARNKTLGFMAAVAQELRTRGADTDLVLIIDEINRGDISKVFGELIYGLEYRDEAVATPYAVDGQTTLELPDRLLLIGTMNTADRSIAVVDLCPSEAFRFPRCPAGPERRANLAALARCG